MEASLLIPSLLVNCILNSLAKSPNKCCKLSLKNPEGSGIRCLNLNLNFRVSIGPNVSSLQNDQEKLNTDLLEIFRNCFNHITCLD